MPAIFEGRESDSPYVKRVWRGYFEEDFLPICPADSSWNLLFMRRGQQIGVAIEGAVTAPLNKSELGETEFLVIQFSLGVYMPQFLPMQVLNQSCWLPNPTHKQFQLQSSTWQIPNFDNVEVFVAHLVHEDWLVRDPIITDTLHGYTSPQSERTLRRRFLHTTGMTLNTIHQIHRVRQAVALMEQGTPIVDVAAQTGYADQAHLTRSVRRYFGQTPTQLLRLENAEVCPICSRPGLMVDLCYTCKRNNRQPSRRSLHHA